jgi:hypothetical protein
LCTQLSLFLGGIRTSFETGAPPISGLPDFWILLGLLGEPGDHEAASRALCELLWAEGESVVVRFMVGDKMFVSFVGLLNTQKKKEG